MKKGDYFLLFIAIILFAFVPWWYALVSILLLLLVDAVLYNLRVIKIIPEDERDQQLLKMAQGAKMSNTTLPSGFLVPQAPDGTIWVVIGEAIYLVKL